MNERIKDLLDQSGIKVKSDLSGFNLPEDINLYHAQGFDLEKFAELIIRECAAACDTVAEEADTMKNSKYVTDYGRMLHEGMWGGAQNCKVEILNRFEIE